MAKHYVGIVWCTMSTGFLGTKVARRGPKHVATLARQAIAGYLGFHATKQVHNKKPNCESCKAVSFFLDSPPVSFCRGHGYTEVT